MLLTYAFSTVSLFTTALLVEKMPYTYEDRIAIKHYREKYRWGSKRILKELGSGKNWTQRGIQAIIEKVDATQSIARKPGSGRPRTARTQENIEEVELRILSQEERQTRHETPSEIAKTMNISKSSVRQIAKNDLN